MCTTTDWCIERDVFFLVDEFRIKNNNDDRHFSSRDEERERETKVPPLKKKRERETKVHLKID